ncbi:Exodeoxyribonuclease 7 large subunit [Dermatophilus congolensis]|uniref:Exodeoxyribonuclease 7 large subunit n=1 Tax=Dermatophilus congolensis TaxID=1863 RepID=A0A239VQW9_9MICO|nr:Exodeoxyribonuclease 7 large subunit [Dermatophilus congolensis]
MITAVCATLSVLGVILAFVSNSDPSSPTVARPDSDGAPRELPAKAAETTAENPWPLRLLTENITAYINRMSALWIEAQVIELKRRPGAWSAFLTLRDVDIDMSLNVSIPTRTLDALPDEIGNGQRVVVHCKPTFWAKRGSFQMEARDIRPVGQGELLAQIERLKKLLESEGLFDPSRKKSLPFLPRCIGLICGRESAAERDVVENARRRWPGVDFEIREVAVQGRDAVPQVSRALCELDDLAHVDVIVIARGGGSFEDLLAFSNETLLRAVAAARTPVVSAIGHEVDVPLLDFVADVRASTPTDSAKRLVPDHAEESEALVNARVRMQQAVRRRLDNERRGLATMRTRPVLATPKAMLRPYREQRDALHERVTRATGIALAAARADLRGHVSHLGALSPQSTLERGYAVVQQHDGSVIRDPDQVRADEVLRVRVAGGDFTVMSRSEQDCDSAS